MLKRIIVFSLLILLLSAVAASAQDVKNNGLYFKVDFLNLKANSDSSKALNVFTYNDNIDALPSDNGYKFSFDYKPVNFSAWKDRVIVFNLGYKQDNKNFWVSRWRFSSSSSVGNYLVNPGTEKDGIFTVYGIQLWDYTFYPSQSFLELSGYSPIIYSASNDIQITRTEFLASFSADNRGKFKTSAIVGFGLARVTNHRVESFNRISVKQFLYLTDQFYKDSVTMSSDSKSDFKVSGPILGIQEEVKWLFVRVHALARSQYLFGSVKQGGLWQDVEKEAFSQLLKNGELLDTIDLGSYLGQSSFNEKRHVSASSSDVRIGTDLPLFQERLTLGINYYISYWTNINLAPKWHNDGSGIGGGSEWKDNKNNLMLNGYQFSIKFVF